MENLLDILQIIVAVSVLFVWTFRFHNVEKEFKQFGIKNVTRDMVGTLKISLAVLLIVGVWHPSLVLIPSILMGFMMLAAQYFHFKVNNSFLKRLPSLVLLILSWCIAYFTIA
ncbi:DoxX family protein [Christiangramia echinicola]|uniref:DoxX-like family protein n=1 Tax=Christiangramia echinicola TaxID=279359 RepID=A0A1H1RG92_9FLAO|nr:DoxX family protein [Christiangramia echinicola]SDS34710.1 DoxX-like family protein [Christiangramia echinicola]